MRGEDAIAMATAELEKHGVRGWVVRMEYRSTRRAGHADYVDRVILLSGKLFSIWSDEHCRLTILHEVAHAIVGPGHGHDAVWKAKCLEIGGDGREFYTGRPALPEARPYQAVCTHCGQKYSRKVAPAAGFRYSCPNDRTELVFKNVRPVVAAEVKTAASLPTGDSAQGRIGDLISAIVSGTAPFAGPSAIARAASASPSLVTHYLKTNSGLPSVMAYQAMRGR